MSFRDRTTDARTARTTTAGSRPVARAAAVLTAALLAVVSSALTVRAPADAAVARSCTGAQLALGHRPLSGGDSHDGLVLEFRNRGRHACTLYGYPGFDAVNAHGGVRKHAKRTFEGYLGGSAKHRLTTVRVRPGHYASAAVEWEVAARSGRTCHVAAGFAFTAAGTKRTVYRYVREVSVCQLQVHPTVPGRSGQLR